MESIKEHSGWVIKHVRGTIQNGPSIQTIEVSKNSEASCEDLVPLFHHLHESLEKIVKASLEEDANKDILKHGLEILSTDKTLRGAWCNINGNSEDQQIKAVSCVLVLQRIAVMFLKSKQQIIREQLQLKPKKQSSSLQQSLKSIK
ncbi:Hypothetical predicted protein [Paramuricea clavata]|uniref:Uncharacterized protein n=1 Tax=Paramuricea clavata TaxID=317549 RepID=A0A7D9DBV9_PARCT|nr:Hypothetical predicted protein [Paramuricea clavata]